MSDKNIELSNYLKWNSESLAELARSIELEADRIVDYHDGDIDSLLDHAKGFYGIAGLLRYMSNYMEQHSKDALNNKFFLADREKLEK